MKNGHYHKPAVITAFFPIVFLIIFSSAGFSQKPNLIHFSAQDGLPSSHVYYSMRDTSGYVWISTNRGLAKFDGHQCTVFNMTDGLPSNDIWGTFEDKEGRIWLSTFNEVVYYQDGRFHWCKKAQSSDFIIYSFFDKKEGGVYFTTDEARGNLYAVEGEEARKVGAFRAATVKSVANMPDGSVNFAVVEDALRLYKLKDNVLSVEFEWGGLTQPDTWAAWLAPNWLFFTGDNIIIYSQKKAKTFGLSELIGQEVILERIIPIAEDKIGLVTNKGFFFFDNFLNRIPSLAFLSELDPNFIKEDENGNIWVSTPEGLYLLTSRGRHSVHYNIPGERAENKCNALVADTQGRFWIGTQAGELFALRQGMLEQCFDFKAHFGNQNVRMIHFISSDKLLAGGDFGLAVLQKGPQEPDEWKASQFFPGNFKHITANGSGQLFVAAAEGVFKYNEQQNTLDTLMPGRAYACAYDEEGNRLWIGKKKGLFTSGWDGTGFGPPELALDVPVNSLEFDAGGRLWVATDGYGLLTLDGNRQDSIPELSNKAVIALASEDRFTTWAITHDGVFRIESGRGDSRLSSVQRISAASGVFSDELNDVAINGDTICLATDKGITITTTGSLAKKNRKPNLLISQILINNRDTSIQPFYSLRHGQNRIRIHYAGLSFQSLGEVTFMAKMEGLAPDSSWEKTGDFYKEYIGLPPGDFTFRLKAIDGSGQETEERKVRFVIHPPWWATWWAMSLWAVLTLTGAYWVYRFLLSRRLAASEARRLRELDHAKAQLYTNITHEFRTPLTVILGMVDQMKDDPSNWFLEGLKLIRRNGQRLLHLVNQLLDLAKLDSGNLPLKLIQGDIVVYLQYLCESFQPYAESKDIRLHFRCVFAELQMDYDPEKLQNVISNLLSNAIKFTPAGGDVYFELHRPEMEEKKEIAGVQTPALLIQVSDNGPGIAPEHLPFIFDRFYQADGSSVRRGGGTGIGLALARELARLMGGHIWAESIPGEGARFKILLPITRNAPLQRAGEPEKTNATFFLEKETTPSGKDLVGEGQHVVLLVEDSPDVIAYLSAVLSPQYQIITARNGQEGINKAFEEVPDIIVSDVMMPDKDGFELCQELKTDHRTSHIPIILLTARADQASRVEGLAHGADAYLAKPFYKEELLVRLENLIELRRRLQERFQQPGGFQQILAVEAENREDAFLQKAILAIEEQLDDETFGMPQLCKALHLSRSNLYRKVKALTGKPATHLIRAVRLGKARELLETTNMSIADISFRVGIHNPNYFSRIFREEYGVPPSQMRK